MAKTKTHAVLALTHALFEVCDRSPLNPDDQITAAGMLLELVKGSRSGYVKVSLEAAQGVPIQSRDTEDRSADHI